MEYTVSIVRDSLKTPWGFRLQGGADLRATLSVQRVFTGSPAEGELQRGDILQEIDGRDATCLSHRDAENIIKAAGSELKLRIHRTGQNQSLPHTDFGGNIHQTQGDMWKSPNEAYGTQFTGAQGRPGITPHDQAMLNLVQHSLGNGPSSLYPSQRDVNSNVNYGWTVQQAPGPVYGQHPPQQSYQPMSFSRPTPGAPAYKPSKNPYSSTANAAHLQYNSPLGLYSAKNAQNVLSTAVPSDSAAGKTIKAQLKLRNSNNAVNTRAKPPRLTSHQGGETKGDVVDSPTLRFVLREDEYKAKTGQNPNVKFYKEQHEYGPGKGPLRIYREDLDEPRATDF